jgi:Mg-chelatase subunit ChlD
MHHAGTLTFTVVDASSSAEETDKLQQVHGYIFSVAVVDFHKCLAS